MFAPDPVDNWYDRPAPFQTDLGSYYKTLAYDALYHSPFAAVNRGTDLLLTKQFGSYDGEAKINPDQANERFGLGGQLTFDEPIFESAAKLMYDRKVAELRREQLISNGSTDIFRGLTGLGMSMAASLLDPVNFGSMFFPMVGPKSLVKPATIRSLTGGSKLAGRIVEGGVDAAAGQFLVEPFVLSANLYEQSNYGFADSLFNIGGGAVLGSGLKVGAGILADKFNILKDYIRELSPEEQREMIKQAVTQMAQDEPVTSPAEVLSLTDKVVNDTLREDIELRQSAERQENYLLRSRSGYELLVEQYKEGKSNLPVDEAEVQRQVDEELGDDFNEKIRPSLLTAKKPIKSLKGMMTSIRGDIETVLRTLIDSLEGEGASAKLDSDDLIKSFLKHGLDSEHPIETLIGDMKAYQRIYRAAGKMGYNLSKAKKVTAGTESIVYIFDDTVVKVSNDELSRSEIPGLTTVTESITKEGSLYVTISERVRTLAEISDEGGVKIRIEDFEEAFNSIGSKIGKVFEDVTLDNVGITAEGRVVLFDTGNILDTPKKRGRPKKISDSAQKVKDTLTKQMEEEAKMAKMPTKEELDAQRAKAAEKIRKRIKEDSAPPKFEDVNSEPMSTDRKIVQERIEAENAALLEELEAMEKELGLEIDDLTPTQKSIINPQIEQLKVVQQMRKAAQLVNDNLSCPIGRLS